MSARSRSGSSLELSPLYLDIRSHISSSDRNLDSRPLIYVLTLIPMAVGMNMITLGWLVVLGRHGFINSFLLQIGVINEPLGLMYTWGAMIVGLTNVQFTFMVLPIAAVLKTIDPSVEQAARNLGANFFRTFLFVTLPSVSKVLPPDSSRSSC